MLISRVRLAPSAPAALLSRVAVADAYGDHKALWSLFPASGSERPFLFRREDQHGAPSFIVVSSRPPTGGEGLWSVETKSYRPALRAGQRLRFLLRVNPVVSRRDGAGRQARHDVVMDARWQLRRERVPRAEWPQLSELVQRLGVEWLSARATAHGFHLVEGATMCNGYRQHRVPRRGSRAATFSTVDLTGLLVVAEPDAMCRTLFEGLGHAKSFGCGLLLVRPAS